MVRKSLKILLRKNLAKYLFLGIFSMSFLYPFFPSSPPKNKPSSINFESSIFSSEITSSVNGLSTSLNVDSKGANVSISRNNSQIKFATPLTDASISHSLNEVTYKVPNNNIELRYKLLENGLKEDIVLHKIPQENIFKSNLITKNLTFKISQNGTPVFYDPDGQYQFHVQQPYAVDASGAITYSLKYFLLEKPNTKNEYILALEIDKQWLHDSARVLPITIDPTVVHDTYAEFTTGSFNRSSNINDTLVLSSTNVTAANGYTYVKALSDNTTISTGDRFEYDVFITNNTTNVGSIDIKYTDASYARSSGWLDENGVGCSAGNLSSYAYNQWFHRACIFSATDNGKTLSYIDLVNELNTNIGVTAYYDNFVIKDSSGNIKSTIYTNGAPTFNVIDIASNAGNTGTVIVSNSLSDPLPNIETNYQENTSDVHTVGLWHMNEASGNLLDSSGNGNTGAPTGTTVTTGLLGNARRFNGSSDYIDIANSTAFDVQNFTIESWVYSSNFVHNGHIFEKGPVNSQYSCFFANTDLFYFRTLNAAATSDNLSFTISSYFHNNAWNHVACVYDGTQKIVYVNGEIAASKTYTETMRTGQSGQRIGAYGGTASYFFNGIIDDLRFSNIARSSEEIKMSASRRPYSTYTSPLIDFSEPINSWNSFSWTELKASTGDGETISDSTGLIAQWNFNETGDVYTTTPAGSCGSACIGTLNNFNTYAQDDIPSAVGGTLTVVGNYNVHTFKAGTVSFDPGPVYFPIEMLLIGGGGGGANTGSGGGAGGYYYTPRRWLNTYQYLYDVKVGVGGSGGATTSASGTIGGDTQLLEDGSVMREAEGGGYGVSHGNSSGGKGASGGGGPIRVGPPFSTGGLNTQGNLGGAGYVESGWTGNSGGGGGAGGMGMNGGNVAGSGNGGIGLTSSITGTNTWYSGGGGGGEVNGSYVGVGGSGGGGTAVIDAAGGNGTANTGGGGAGGSYNSGTYFNGGNGGSGIGIIRYQNIQSGWTSDHRWGTGAVKFDGIDDYVRTAGPVNYAPTTTSSFTAETWVKFNQSTSSQAIIQTEDGTGTGRVLLGILNTNNVYTYIGGVQLTSTTKLNPGTWYHLAVVYNGSGETIYINGQADASASNIVEVNNAQITFGANKTTPPPSGYLSGIMDSTRLYSRALSTQELISNYNAGNIEFQTRVGDSTDPNDGSWNAWSPTTSETAIASFDSDIANWSWDTSASTMPVFKFNESVIKMEGSGSMKIGLGIGQTDAYTVGLWHLDETSGTGAYIRDSSSSGSHGTPTGTSSQIGKSGNSRFFTASSNELISLGVVSALNFTSSSFTSEAWVKVTSNATANYITSNDNGTNGWSMSITTGNLVQFNTRGLSVVTTTSTGTVPLNKWTHVAVVYTGSAKLIYINGVLDISQNVTGTINSSATTFTLGSRGSTYFDGYLDEIRISNIARSAEAIAENHRLGRDHYINRIISSTDLSTKTSLPFYVAADRTGSYLTATIGESAYANYQPDANTVAFYHLDEQSGTGAFIKNVGGTNHGTLGTGTSAPSFVPGKIGGGRSFDGLSDYITIGTTSTTSIGTLLNGSTANTLDLWVMPLSVATSLSTITDAKINSTSIGLSIDLHLNVIQCRARSDGADSANTVTAPQPPVGIWTHVACVADYTNKKLYLYVNGMLVGSTLPIFANNAYTQGTPTRNDYIGTYSPSSAFSNVNVDEVRYSKTARTAEEIRQAYNIGTRTHQITIDFAAKLVSSNLVVGSTDYSFNIDTTVYGLGTSANSLYLSDKIIVQENIGGTEFTTQGTVNSVNANSGAITVSSWDAGSSFPAGGFTANATVFKWQKEYFPITSSINEDRNAITQLTIRINNGHEGRKVWIDDLRSAGSYLTNSIGSTITSSLGHRYFQYRSILTSHNYAISPSFTGVTSDYVSNESPTLPTLIIPINIATTQSLTPTFKTVSTDSDGDFIQYEIKICTDSSMTTNCLTFDQTSSNIGWSGMNVGTSAFSSGTTATYILQTGSSLAYNGTYYWKTRAIDPSGSNTWSSTQVTPFSFTTDTTSSSPTVCTIDQTSYPGSYLVKWTDTSSDESGFEIYRLKNGVGTIINTTSANAISYSDTDIQSGNTYAYRIRAKKTATGGTFAYSPYCDTTQLSPATNNFLIEGLRLEGLQLE